jgi:hypothetical protein
MHPASKREDSIRVYLPRVQLSPPRQRAAPDVVEVSVDAQHNHAHEMYSNGRKGLPAQLVEPALLHAALADTAPAPSLAMSPLRVAHISPRHSPSPRLSPTPLRDVGGTVYHQPLAHSRTQISPSDALVHRLQSFLPAASRPSTRQSRAPADIAAEGARIMYNGPALDRFPLSVQGGLSALQVKRAHTPAYEPRVLGHERQPLTQTWLVSNPAAKGEAQALVLGLGF